MEGGLATVTYEVYIPGSRPKSSIALSYYDTYILPPTSIFQRTALMSVCEDATIDCSVTFG